MINQEEVVKRILEKIEVEKMKSAIKRSVKNFMISAIIKKGWEDSYLKGFSYKSVRILYLIVCQTPRSDVFKKRS